MPRACSKPIDLYAPEHTATTAGALVSSEPAHEGFEIQLGLEQFIFATDSRRNSGTQRPRNVAMFSARCSCSGAGPCFATSSSGVVCLLRELLQVRSGQRRSERRVAPEHSELPAPCEFSHLTRQQTMLQRQFAIKRAATRGTEIAGEKRTYQFRASSLRATRSLIASPRMTG